ncbi:MAG: hypothetical protein JST39_07545, partial [Bacteroidetes bacterium]|nr:hypothetical protein [Bacteroidota bacterium]
MTTNTTLLACVKNIFLCLAVLLAAAPGYAQLCSGSLGDPVVNITFGTGSNPGAPLKTTNYTYVSTDCPADGYYTVRNSTSNCFNNWFTLTEDHTPGDVNGYMMLVNASYSKGDFYVDTVHNLCSGT